MINEEQKFRVETLRIFGLALLTPVCSIFLNLSEFFSKHSIIYSSAYIIISIGLAFFGFLLIEVARGILYERGINKWK